MAGVDVNHFLVLVSHRTKEGWYDDVLLLRIGDKLHHLLNPAWKSRGLRELEYELQRALSAGLTPA
jgi:hypothetical protein